MPSTLWASRPKSTLDCQLLLLGGEGAGKVKLFPHGRGHLQHGTGHEDPRASVGVRKLFTHLPRRVLLGKWLPPNTILGNWASGVRGSFKTTTYHYTPLGRFRLRHALRSSLKLAMKAIKKMIAGKPRKMMASQYVSTVRLM